MTQECVRPANLLHLLCPPEGGAVDTSLVSARRWSSRHSSYSKYGLTVQVQVHSAEIAARDCNQHARVLAPLTAEALAVCNPVEIWEILNAPTRRATKKRRLFRAASDCCNQWQQSGRWVLCSQSAPTTVSGHGADSDKAKFGLNETSLGMLPPLWLKGITART